MIAETDPIDRSITPTSIYEKEMVIANHDLAVAVKRLETIPLRAFYFVMSSVSVTQKSGEPDKIAAYQQVKSEISAQLGEDQRRDDSTWSQVFRSFEERCLKIDS